MHSPQEAVLEAAFRHNLLRAGARPTIPDALVARDLEFADSEMRLDLYRPERDNRPILVFIHGGGWRASGKDRYDPIGRSFAGHGFVTIILDYRLAPHHPHPAAALDVADAVAWAAANGHAFGGDPARLIVMGQSAGAHLGALISSNATYLAGHGLGLDALAGFVGLSGIYDLTRPLLGLPLERHRALIPAFGSDPAAWLDASPVSHLTVAGPPVLLAVAQHDPAAIHHQRDAFAARLLSLGRPLTTMTVPHRDHHTALASLGTATDPLTRWLADGHWPSPVGRDRFERHRSEQ